jgi:hypothetical protein
MTDYTIRYKVTGSDIGYAGENRRIKNVDKGQTKVTADSPEEARKKFNSKKTELHSYKKVRDAVSGNTPRVSVDRISSGPAGKVKVHYESKKAESGRLRHADRKKAALSEGQSPNIARRGGAAASQSPSLRSGSNIWGTQKTPRIKMKKGGIARETRVF